MSLKAKKRPLDALEIELKVIVTKMIRDNGRELL